MRTRVALALLMASMIAATGCSGPSEEALPPSASPALQYKITSEACDALDYSLLDPVLPNANVVFNAAHPNAKHTYNSLVDNFLLSSGTFCVRNYDFGGNEYGGLSVALAAYKSADGPLIPWKGRLNADKRVAGSIPAGVELMSYDLAGPDYNIYICDKNLYAEILVNTAGPPENILTTSVDKFASHVIEVLRANFIV
ncbi:hypothetical protein WEI85_22505 [Actinomycetes bacterium KLBMP 9797]